MDMSTTRIWTHGQVTFLLQLSRLFVLPIPHSFLPIMCPLRGLCLVHGCEQAACS